MPTRPLPSDPPNPKPERWVLAIELDLDRAPVPVQVWYKGEERQCPRSK